jgi:hypothetical protein
MPSPYSNNKADLIKYSHITVPALDGLADQRRRDVVGDLDVPHFAFALRGEVGEQLRGYRYIADLVAAQVEAARDFFERWPPPTQPSYRRGRRRAACETPSPYPPSFIAQIRMRNP